MLTPTCRIYDRIGGRGVGGDFYQQAATYRIFMLCLIILFTQNMIVESMDDSEFVLEVVRDFLDEMRFYVLRAMAKKKIKTRHASNYTSKRGNQWFIIYRPEAGGRFTLSVKRPQPKEWFTWYSLILAPQNITLFGFTKHVAQRISERYHPELTPSAALKEMLIKTPAIIQSEVEDSFYTRVNGGVCLGSTWGRKMSLNIRGNDIHIGLIHTNTFISDDGLFDNQKKITKESIARAIKALGKNCLPDEDREDYL